VKILRLNFKTIYQGLNTDARGYANHVKITILIKLKSYLIPHLVFRSLEPKLTISALHPAKNRPQKIQDS
jgi:hypothetical protein